jgi:hypothetical protein
MPTPPKSGKREQKVAKSLISVDKTSRDQIRKVVCYGRIPKPARPNSGLFSIYIKEDAFEVEITDRHLRLNSGAKTEKSHSIPLYYINEVFSRRKQLVESAGITDTNGKLELLMQYARLPLIDPPKLKFLQNRILEASEGAKAVYIGQRDQQAQYDMFLYELCDFPITLVKPDWDKGVIQLKARVPRPPSVNIEATKTKRGKANYIRDYLETIASDACRFAIAAFDRLPGLSAIEITLARMEAMPIEGVNIEQELELIKPAWQFKKSEFGRIDGAPPALKDKEIKPKLSVEEKKQEKARLAEEKKKRKFVQATSYTNASDELFDGSLRHESVLLSVRLPRPEFRELLRSRDSYTSTYAVKLFDPRLHYDEEEGIIFPTEPIFKG